MINKQLNYIIEKYHIIEIKNILYGTNIPMPKMVLPTPWKTYIDFEKTERYFFFFDERGITIYPFDGSNYGFIPWQDITDFKVKHVSILGKMTITTTKHIFNFQLNRFVFGCPWIKKNTKYLEGFDYYYHK